jgi:hypothetical protein
MTLKGLARVAMLLAVVELVTASAVSAQEPSRFAVELELGPAWQSRNDVQIPNDAEGTRFSLVDVAGNGPWPAGRLYLSWNLNDRHGLRALAAPLSFTEDGTLDEPVEFAGASYLPGVPTEATYQFDSWRLTYRYRFHDGDRWTWWIGATAKIRDAKIELAQGDVTSRDTDLGFVPLLHLAADWRLAKRWHLLLDLDALAGGPGRAEDFAAKLAYDLNDRWSITAGYRTVEGGADTDDVYAFAWFHYAVVSGIYRF